MSIHSTTAQWRLLDDPSSLLGVPAFVTLLNQCSNLQQVVKVHSRIRQTGLDQSDRYIGNSLISAYGRCGGVHQAEIVLQNLQNPNVKSWNMLITACVRHGQDRQALHLYRTMNCQGRTQPDHITFVSILSACSNLGDLSTGRAVHERIISQGFEANVIVSSAVVSMFSKCLQIDQARQAFERMRRRNVISWNTMITAYGQNGDFAEALSLFQRMDCEPDCFTFSAILGACAVSGDLRQGRKIHERIRASGVCLDVAAHNALVSMYVGNRSLSDARDAFDRMKVRDIVSWNAMIVGYVQSGHAADAIALYKILLNTAAVRPNTITYASVLTACSLTGDADEGRRIHRRILSSSSSSSGASYELSISVQNSLVNFYAKCGSFEEAKLVFAAMRVRDLFSWNTMIAACSKHQRCEEMEVVLRHQVQEGHQPDEVTYTCILHTCSHMGLLEQGCDHFTAMLHDHFLLPVPDHFRILLDLLGRAGLLSDAELLIDSMPFQPDCVAWKSLLSACKNQGDADRGESLAQRLLGVDSQSSAPYVLISHIQRVRH